MLMLNKNANRLNWCESFACVLLCSGNRCDACSPDK